MVNSAKPEEIFLICPECHMEHKILSGLNDSALFLTSLGAVFNMEEFEYAEEVNLFLTGEDVRTLNIVVNLQCTFIDSVLNERSRPDIKAEVKLKEYWESINKEDFNSKLGSELNAKKLAVFAIQQQAKGLMETAFIGTKIDNEQIVIKGWIYHPKTARFEEVRVH